MAAETSRSSVAYWVLVAVLVVFGALGMFTIGAPFLITGVTLAVLAPVRNRPRVFWPVVLGVVGFFLGYVLVAPVYCSQSESFTSGDVVETVNPTLCRSLIGITYSGTGNYNPPLAPGFAAGIAVGGLSALGAWLFVRARSGP